MDICELHRKHLFLYCCIYGVLHSNGSYPIAACVFFVAGMRLPIRFPATGIHVTILIQANRFYDELLSCGLLGCIALQFRKSLTFRTNLWPPYRGSDIQPRARHSMIIQYCACSAFPRINNPLGPFNAHLYGTQKASWDLLPRLEPCLSRKWRDAFITQLFHLLYWTRKFVFNREIILSQFAIQVELITS
jgi:hypothetical protein